MDRDNNRNNIQKDRENTSNANNNNRGNGLEQYSNNLGNKIADIEDEDSFLNDINQSLAKQISMEMEENDTGTKDNGMKKKKFPKGLKIFAIAFSVFMIICGLLVFTPGGRKLIFSIAGKYIYDKLDYENSNPTQEANEPVPTKKPVKQVEHVVNILLLGVEEIEGASNTDVMIIATMNTKNKTVKLTSLMRDNYVQIPGHDKNKLNAAFALGGINLLYDTIYNNFGIRPDGYIKVNFDAFEKVVDLVGGVEITLTKREANYLNTTNYISNPANRHVVEGKQIMNGNQALGYCRVRKVSTGTENNDFGRTQRHRAVLNAIFDKLKSKNILQLGLFMNDVISDVDIKTDITQSEFNEYLEEGASLNIKKLDELRIPSDGNYQSSRVPIGRYNVEVLEPTDWDATRKEIHDFIYGDEDSTTEALK